MNRAVVDRLANALLYEGYLLYPYRPSVKNHQRWTFGGLYPPSYARAQGGSDLSAMQTQCLVRGGPGTRLTVAVRFLQLVARQVGEFDPPLDEWSNDKVPTYRAVSSLQTGESVVSSWQEAIEREINVGVVDLGDLLDCPRWVEFEFEADRTHEPVRGLQGTIVGVIARQRRRIDGGACLTLETVAEGVYRLTARVENRTRFAAGDDREEALLQALVSTHTILGVENGAFVSSLDPPEPLRTLAAACVNQGTWPVLVGDEGQTDTLLSSPIILYDHPQVAPESPGDLFDATEIDEILTLRIMTLTDDEKRSMAALDPRGRALLERTETLARDQLMALHGTLRELRPVAAPGEAP